MKEFTFVTITYNHERFIVEHLESIRALIAAHGDGMQFDIVIADDCSKDQTVRVAEEWFESNRGLFRDVVILDRKKNLGTIRNLYDAVAHCKTHFYKLLAGDDKYYTNDLFGTMEQYDGKLVVTPIIPFGGDAGFSGQAQTYRFLYSDKKHLGKWIRYRNLILAPGVFIPIEVWQDEELKEYLFRYTYIEDYPMWYYLLNTKRIDYDIITTPFVCYRMNSGISRNKKQKTFSAWEQEHEALYKDLKVRIRDNGKKKFLNPYWYELTVMRRFHSGKKDIIRVFSDNPDLKPYYVDQR